MNGGGAAAAVNGLTDPELAAIAEICTGSVARMSEGGRRYIHMHGLRFLAGGVERQMDALLALDHANPSYPTRLYLPENIGLGLNWHENAFILGRQWFSWSWSGVMPDDKPLAILANHLKAFQQGGA